MPHETSVIGPYTLGNLDPELHVLSDAQSQHRLRFAEFCLSHDMAARSTFFEKPAEQLVTYKAVGVKEWKPPWQIHKFTQMDFFLINSKWKNSITNTTTTNAHAVETDHKPMIASVTFKLKANTRRQYEKTIKYHKPPPLQIDTYNDCIRKYAEDNRLEEQEQQYTNVFDRLKNILLRSANESFDERHPEIKKPYISQHTWGLLEQKWSAIERGDQDIAAAMNQEVKKQVQQNRENDLLQQRRNHSSGLQVARFEETQSKFTPSFPKFKDLDGNHVPLQDYASKAAEYLEHVQRKAPDQDDNEVLERISHFRMIRV